MLKIAHPLLRSQLLLLFSLLVSSCIKEDTEDRGPHLPKRTVLVYLAGDNNLDAIGLTPELLQHGWTYTGSRCLIYYDAPNAAPKLLSLRGGCSVTPTPYIETVAEYEEENSASAEVFARVIRDVVSGYPADSYGLVFASHASGWLPAGALADPRRENRSVGSDYNPATMAQGASEMELADFAAAIPDHQFDFIIFEACLMAGVEVAYELRNKTDYLLASSAEMLSPGYGIVYPSASKYLFDTRLDVGDAVRRFAQSYYDNMNARSGAYRSATQSVIHTRRLDELAALAGEVFGDEASSLGGCDVETLQHFDRPGSYGDTQALPRYFDFAEYLKQVAPERFGQVASLLNQIVVWKAATPEFMTGQNGFQIRTHCGLTTYIAQEAFPTLNIAYEQTAWWRALSRQKNP